MKSKYYEGTSQIINLSTEIGKLLGVVEAAHLRKPTTKLRKANRIKSIQSSLWIEGNSLSEVQVSDIINNKRVLGSEKDIREVKNAIEVYESLGEFRYDNLKSYLKAHKLLMKGLVENPGVFRTKGVGVFKGEIVAHVAPPAWNVENLMQELFKYLKTSNDNLIIKSCVFHYEMEFIHPFMDGNGRMGRLWQTVILMKENPVFEFLPIEHEIKIKQQNYYDALGKSDKEGVCTVFVEFMLEKIKVSLTKLIKGQRSNLSDIERINYFASIFEEREFARQDYLEVFKEISLPTASRDMKKGIELNFWEKTGENRTTKYKINPGHNKL
jgi:Fic family protein